MPKFKVYAERTETICAIIEADSAEDAEILADQNYSDHDWSDVNESLKTEILFNQSEEKKTMNNHIIIPLTEVMLKAGDRVRLVEPEVLIARSNNPDINYTNDFEVYSFKFEDDYLSFNSVDVDNDMLTLLYTCDTQEIKSIDKDGDIEFIDMPYTWPKEVILEQVDENDIALNTYIDSSNIDYIRIYKDEVGYDAFLNYCSMPHAVLSKEDDGNSVYFYTVSQQNINPDKHLE